MSGSWKSAKDVVPSSGSSADQARQASMTAAASAPSNHSEPP